jgi:hypothetical protein
MAAATTLLALILGSQSPAITESNFEHWRDFIKPAAHELKFEEVSWRPTFWSAVVEGQTRKKPILLWAMNGHPMACT